MYKRRVTKQISWSTPGIVAARDEKNNNKRKFLCIQRISFQHICFIQGKIMCPHATIVVEEKSKMPESYGGSGCRCCRDRGSNDFNLSWSWKVTVLASKQKDLKGKRFLWLYVMHIWKKTHSTFLTILGLRLDPSCLRCCYSWVEKEVVGGEWEGWGKRWVGD